VKYQYKTVSVYLTLDQHLMQGYYNPHDPTPIYNRQLSQQQHHYIMDNVAAAKRYDVIIFKFKYTKELDRSFAEPIMYSIRRHYLNLKILKLADFKRFKRRNFMLLITSTLAVMLLHMLLAYLIRADKDIHSLALNTLDIVSWVILWHPIDELIFNWNTHLKQICLFDKLSSAEMIIMDNAKNRSADTFDAEDLLAQPA
jgi:hypothetical protein